MKKLLLWLICVGLGVSAWAGSFHPEETKQKIRTLTLLEEEAFDWEDMEYDDPSYQAMLNLAQEVYGQNPGSFPAAYNYGLLLSAVYAPEIGPCTDDKALKQAFAAFEHARTLSPNKKMLFEREYDVLKRMLIGADVPTRLLVNEDIFDIYRQNPKYSQKFVEVIARTFRLNGLATEQKAPEQVWQDRALQAFLIRLAQQDYDNAAIWLKRLGGPEELKGMWFVNHQDSHLMNIKNQDPKNWQAQQVRYDRALSHVGVDVSSWREELKQRQQAHHLQVVKKLQKALKQK